MSPWIVKIIGVLLSAWFYVLARGFMEILTARVEQREQAVREFWRRRRGEL